MKKLAIISFVLVSAILLVSTIEVKRSHATIAVADLELSKSGASTANKGDNLTYTITVTNNGPDPAANVSWTDTLPAGTTFVGLSPAPLPAGWSCTTPADGDTGTVTCSNPSLAVGSATIYLTLGVSPTVPAGSTISNTATVTSSTPDGNPGNESGTATTTIISPSLVSGNKSRSGGTSEGASLSYLIILKNDGNSDQQDNPGNEFTDVLPADLTLVGASASGGTATANPGTNTVTWNGVIPAQDTITVSIDATIKTGTAGHTISNTGTISYDADGNGTNEASASTNTDSFVVGAAVFNADLGVIKTGPDTSPANSDVSYVITVTNGGPDTATSATLNDTLPGDMTFVSVSKPAGWSCATPAIGSGGTITCSRDLPAGSGAQVFNLVGHIPPGTADGTFYDNHATVSTTSNDATPENDQATAGTTVGCINNFVVTTSADSGTGSLRQGIAYACDGGTIIFDPTLTSGGPATITLTSAELVINKNLTITGPGANLLTIQRSTAGGTPNFRIFDIASTFSVTISGLTITNGNLNGAVIPAADSDKGVSISPDVVAFNPGGGVLNAGTLVLNSVAVARNSADRAGGISNSGTLTLVNSTVSGNISVNLGAGAVNSGGMTIINSTLSGNSTAGQGGGIYNDTGGTLSVTNATITNNRSDSDNTGAEQGGGIFRNAGTVTLKNTIVAGNFRGSGSTRDDVSGAVDGSGSFNLIGDGTNMTGMTNGSNGNQIGLAGSPINALLSSLASNGGATQTHLPLPTSPAINGGSNANLPADSFDLDGDSDTAELLPVDQRGVGFNRVVATVDIGAVESNYVVTATAGSGQSTNVNTAFATALKATVTESGNPQNNVSVTFTAPGSGASGTFPGSSTTATVSTNSSGQATAPTFTANAIGGSYNVIASIGPNTPTASFALTNNKLNQTITFASIGGKTFGDADFSVAPTASSNLAVTLAATGNCTVTTPAPGTVHITGAGSCTITASQAGNSTYNAATDVQQTFNIAKANQTITFPSISGKTFGDADFSVSPTASSNLAVSLAASGNCTVTTPAPGTVHITGAGSCTITASQGGNANFNAAANVQQTFNIAKASTTTTVSALPNPSNSGQSVTFTATVTSGAGTPTGTVQFKDGGANLGSPQTLNGSGVATLATSALTPGLHTITADYSGDTNFAASSGTLAGGQQVGSIIRFSSATYNTTEGAGFTTITVQRIGDLSQAASVNYSTPDDSTATTVLPCSTASGIASPRCDFETSLGTLSWAAGDGSPKTFIVLINQDNFVEGPETLTLTLSNLTGTGVGFTTPGATTATATLTIADDVTEPPGNPLDDTDAFVRQHYRDFLNREPDPSGLAFWKNNIDKCNDPAQRPAGLTLAQCLEVQRINTSAAFFLSIEFQNTGYFVERVYKAGFGDINPPTVPVPVRFTNFLTDTQQIGNGVIVGVGSWQTQLDNNKTTFTQAFVQRSAFLTRYPAALSATAFVDALDANAGNVLSFSERSALIAELSPNPASPTLRASVLRKVAENALLTQREFNRAFVLLQYFGYLRRNPDAAPEPGLNFAGYNFWLNKLNQFNGNYIDAEMVKAFLSSAEYRGRFGP